VYIIILVPNSLALETQVISLAFSRACAKTGKRIAARIAIIAITTTHYRTTAFAMRANIPSLDILIVSRHEYDANIRIARSTVLTKGDRRLTKKPWQDHLFNLLIFGSFQGKVFLTRGGASCNVGDAELKGISVQRC